MAAAPLCGVVAEDGEHRLRWPAVLHHWPWWRHRYRAPGQDRVGLLPADRAEHAEPGGLPAGNNPGQGRLRPDLLEGPRIVPAVPVLRLCLPAGESVPLAAAVEPVPSLCHGDG